MFRICSVYLIYFRRFDQFSEIKKIYYCILGFFNYIVKFVTKSLKIYNIDIYYFICLIRKYISHTFSTLIGTLHFILEYHVHHGGHLMATGTRSVAAAVTFPV
jgi:hypothetical protein